MLHALRKRVTVLAGGRIEIIAPELKPGTEADVIILEEPGRSDGSPLRSFIGAGRGAFATPEEADSFLRGERDAWE